MSFQDENKYFIEVQHKKDTIKEQLRSLMDVDAVWNWLNEDMHWEPEGSVNVEIIEERANGRHIAIDLSEPKRKFERQEESIMEYGIDHCYVWQTVGYCGDDYSGFMLLPLSNGRYLRIRYTC